MFSSYSRLSPPRSARNPSRDGSLVDAVRVAETAGQTTFLDEDDAGFDSPAAHLCYPGPRRSLVAQLLIPVARTSLGGQIEQIPKRLDGASVTRVLIAVRWGVEEL